MKSVSFSGVNQREALKLAQHLGCTVEPIRCTGELRVCHPALLRPIRLNGRRKDAARVLTSALRHLIQQGAGGN